MKKIKALLLGLALASTQLSVFAQDESEKWSYVEKYFASGINTSKLHQKVGAFLNEYSPYMSAPEAALGLFFAILLLGEWYDEYPISVNTTTFIIAPFLAFLITNKTLQFIGKKLENKEGRCSQLLTDFIKNWDQNQKQTPTVLHPLFQELSQRLAKAGKFIKIDNKVAQEIVQTIVANSLISNPIK